MTQKTEKIIKELRDMADTLERNPEVVLPRNVQRSIKYWKQAIREQTPDDKAEKQKATQIAIAVAASRHVSLGKLFGKGREQQIVIVRQMAVYVAQQATSLSWAKLGEIFNKDHATMIHACNAIRVRIEKEPPFARMIAELQRQVTAEPERVAA